MQINFYTQAQEYIVRNFLTRERKYGWFRFNPTCDHPADIQSFVVALPSYCMNPSLHGGKCWRRHSCRGSDFQILPSCFECFDNRLCRLLVEPTCKYDQFGRKHNLVLLMFRNNRFIAGYSFSLPPNMTTSVSCMIKLMQIHENLNSPVRTSLIVG